MKLQDKNGVPLLSSRRSKASAVLPQPLTPTPNMNAESTADITPLAEALRRFENKPVVIEIKRSSGELKTYFFSQFFGARQPQCSLTDSPTVILYANGPKDAKITSVKLSEGTTLSARSATAEDLKAAEETTRLEAVSLARAEPTLPVTIKILIPLNSLHK